MKPSSITPSYGLDGIKPKLIRVFESPNLLKKLRAEFRTNDGRIKHTDFGARGMSDYTIHKDTELAKRAGLTDKVRSERRERYRTRHSKDILPNGRFRSANKQNDLKTHDTPRSGFRSANKQNDPTRPGFLSYYLLWGDSTNLATNIRRYKQLFNL